MRPQVHARSREDPPWGQSPLSLRLSTLRLSQHLSTLRLSTLRLSLRLSTLTLRLSLRLSPLHRCLLLDGKSRALVPDLARTDRREGEAPRFQIYTFVPNGELRQQAEIDAHIGGVNDIAFSHTNKSLSIITCGDDKLIKPFQPVVSPSPNAIAGWMTNPNPSLPHPAIAQGPPGLVQPPNTAAFLKHPRTPTSAPGIDYQSADSEHLMKRMRVGQPDEMSFSGASHPPNVYSQEDLPKQVVRTLNQGSNVMSLDFHPVQQTILLVGTNVGDIGIWEVGSRERIAHKTFKVWDIGSCTLPLQAALMKDAAICVNRCLWSPDGNILERDESEKLKTWRRGGGGDSGGVGWGGGGGRGGRRLVVRRLAAGAGAGGAARARARGGDARRRGAGARRRGAGEGRCRRGAGRRRAGRRRAGERVCAGG
ncbi:Topless-related protein 1 [Hordeum vulgare]|nr:Topless-related protein 1 [Hordeum vulgare]